MKEYLKILKRKIGDFIEKAKIGSENVAKYVSILYQKLGQIQSRLCNYMNILGTYLGEKSVSANLMSWIGFFAGIFAINFLAMEMYGWALTAILLNRFFDALDGAIARSTKVTDFGVFLDATLDYIFYGGIILGFALANPAENSASACFMYFGFVAAACSMLAYSVIAYKNNSYREVNLDYSPFYLGGLAQGAETLVSLVILCLVPGWFKVIAILLGAFSLIKAFSVIVTAYYNFVIVPYRKNSK
jgi:phosphatidylglycerophosphate synthase